MAGRFDTILEKIKQVVDIRPDNKQKMSKTPDAAGAGSAGREAAEGGMTDEDVRKLTRLELLEILVDQRKEIDALHEKLEEVQSRLERDDELIRKFLRRDRPEMRVRRDVKDE